jgi:hypothetical protein
MYFNHLTQLGEIPVTLGALAVVVTLLFASAIFTRTKTHTAAGYPIVGNASYLRRRLMRTRMNQDILGLQKEGYRKAG